MARIQLVKADISHLDLLFRWVNDEDTRKNSFHTEKVLYSDHKVWYEKKLADEKSTIFIAIDKEQRPIGQVRVDFEESIGYIGYSIDTNYRGMGYGREMLELLEQYFHNKLNGSKRILIGRVKFSNIASQKVFEYLCYKKTEMKDYIEYRKILQ